MAYPIRLLMKEFVTHDVRRFIVERPPGFQHLPGQSVNLAIDEQGWSERTRPFSPTSRSGDGVLEFTIKAYPDHHGVTEKLHTLQPGAHLLISDPWGSISYQGPGTFIAGGAGITPFLAIFRQLADEGQLAGQRLIYSNKTPADIICEQELRHQFGERALFLCTRTAGPACLGRRIDRALLQDLIEDFSQHFYVCGPRAFVREIMQNLTDLGAAPHELVFEK